MNMKPVFFAALLGGVIASAPFASAMTIAPLAAPGVDAQKAHMLKVCEHGRCFWTYHHPGWRHERMGYGGGSHRGYQGR